ncbi:hypothetical protein E2I00_016073, partial [Balaenoptera physalus]
EHEGAARGPEKPEEELEKDFVSQEQIAKDLLSGEEEEETQSSADDLTPSEIMVGPQFQADLSKLHSNRQGEKIYENEDQLLWDPNILPEREVEEFLYRAAKRRWHEVAESQLPEGEAVKDSEQADGGPGAKAGHGAGATRWGAELRARGGGEQAGKGLGAKLTGTARRDADQDLDGDAPSAVPLPRRPPALAEPAFYSPTTAAPEP